MSSLRVDSIFLHNIYSKFSKAFSRCPIYDWIELLIEQNWKSQKKKNGDYPPKGTVSLLHECSKIREHGQIMPTNSFVNKVLLEHTGIESCLFVCELHLLSQYPADQSTVFTSEQLYSLLVTRKYTLFGPL